MCYGSNHTHELTSEQKREQYLSKYYRLRNLQRKLARKGIASTYAGLILSGTVGSYSFKVYGTDFAVTITNGCGTPVVHANGSDVAKAIIERQPAAVAA